MRHGNKINHLGRTTGHRASMLANMAVSLIMHKRIATTLAKAKELRTFVEPLITKGKTDSTHSRRMVFATLRSKYAVKELFGAVIEKVGQRPGGYTRILKTGFRHGDSAETAIIELTDYNEAYSQASAAKTERKRTRRSARKSVAAPTTDAAKSANSKQEE
jgi:large subunit ribosomal protein L17